VKSCVIGVGNAFRGDDGVGLHVARTLADNVADDVVVRECEGEPVALLDAWDGYERTILVDAMCSGAPAGTVRRLEADDEPLPPELHRTSTHLLGVAEAIELARALDRLPASTVVYVVEGARFDAGAELSPAVAEAVPAVAAAIRDELEAH
jgi:hydrogenase maturation protease